MKLNNKGFAITLVLYGTLVLFLLLIVSMLGILSTYKLRLEKLYPEVVPLSCEITAKSGYQEKQMLTITPSVSNVTYSWDETNWGVNNVLEDVTFNGNSKTYTAYVKNNTGIVSCSIKLFKYYRSRDCTTNKYSAWKVTVNNYQSSCSAVTDTTWKRECPASRQYNVSNCSNSYYNGTHITASSSSCSQICYAVEEEDCGGRGTCSCKVAVKESTRSINGCSDWGTWSEWSTTSVSAVDYKKQVQIRIGK